MTTWTIAIRPVAVSLILGALLYCNGCTLAGGALRQKKIQPYQNSFMYCRPTAYDPDVAKLVPECKRDPIDSKVYQLTTTVWTRRTAPSAESSPDPPE